MIVRHVCDGGFYTFFCRRVPRLQHKGKLFKKERGNEKVKEIYKK